MPQDKQQQLLLEMAYLLAVPEDTMFSVPLIICCWCSLPDQRQEVLRIYRGCQTQTNLSQKQGRTSLLFSESPLREHKEDMRMTRFPLYYSCCWFCTSCESSQCHRIMSFKQLEERILFCYLTTIILSKIGAEEMAQWLFSQMTQFKSWHMHGSSLLSVTPGDWRPCFSLHMKNTFKIKL